MNNLRVNEEMKELYLEQVKRLTERFPESYKIQSNDSYKDCLAKLAEVTALLSPQTLHAWCYFESVYKDMPKTYRLPIMLEGIYQGYVVDYNAMLKLIRQFLVEESRQERQARIAWNKSVLGNKVRKDGTITVYRGVGEGHLLPDFAVSYTTNKQVAYSYVDLHKRWHGSRFGVTLTQEFSIDEVLNYSDSNGEQEVFILPYHLEGYISLMKNTGYDYVKQNMFYAPEVYLNCVSMQEFQWETEDCFIAEMLLKADMA